MKLLFKISGTLALSALAMMIVAVIAVNIKPRDMDNRVEDLKEYCRTNGYNTEYGILVDYGRLSAQKRFFVYDFKQDKIVINTFAGHGNGGKSTLLKADLSNVPDSHCSSIGHYRIGKERRMYTRNCNAFELDGLDATNSNARSRHILIHPSPNPLSWGCITLSFGQYKELAKLLNSQSKNVIMWIYE